MMVIDKTRDCKNCYSHLVCGVYNPNFENYAPECNLYMGKEYYEKVVRCRDCIHWGGITYGFVCKKFSGIETKICMGADQYCSYGERKEYDDTV